MNMIEKVAIAIAKARGNENTWKIWTVPAKAAIAAMHEPTEEMIKAGRYGYPDFIKSYQLMIDAALKD